MVVCQVQSQVIKYQLKASMFDKGDSAIFHFLSVELLQQYFALNVL